MNAVLPGPIETELWGHVDQGEQLRPSGEVNEVVGGVLARAVQQSAGNVRLHAFTFASNHFHLLVWARGGALFSAAGLCSHTPMSNLVGPQEEFLPSTVSPG